MHVVGQSLTTFIDFHFYVKNKDKKDIKRKIINPEAHVYFLMSTHLSRTCTLILMFQLRSSSYKQAEGTF